MGYVFDPHRVHELCQVGVGKPHEEMFDAVTGALAEAYPGHINTEPRAWIFNNAGGAMGQICLLHASLSEYILIFGTPIGTEGHSGRYRTDVYDFVLEGEFWCYVEGETRRSVFGPGSFAYLGPNAAKGYRIPDSCWMVEYSRGPIPTMLPFGLADSLISTLDTSVTARTFAKYGRLVVGSLLRGKV